MTDTNKEREAAEQWLRDRYGAYRGHFAWRELEEAFLAGRASLAASAGSEPVAWTGGEEWEQLAWHLCAEEHGEDACDEVIWEGGPIPEPWGARWMKYESDAKRMIELVRRFYTHPSPPEGAGWISVDERLPGEQGQDSEQVLVFINGHCELTDMECRRGGAWGLRLGYFDAERQAFRVHGSPEYHVTHWRPEPATPASEAKGA